ncbi:MAG: ABC transporter permease [Coriobacteriia bacterium]|jgi:NitT/TauT family transport system permease protein|nr:ABC transporter permease [Coriobacteriia bacterium]
MNGWQRKAAGYAMATLVMLAVWQIAAWALGSHVLPGPVPAFSAFVADFQDELAPHMLVSIWRVSAATVAGAVLAVPLGLWLGRSPRADAVAAPLIFLTYPVPKVVFLPVLLVLLGLGDASKITLITLIVFFQLLVTARDAARAIPADSVLSVRSLGASKLGVFWHVVAVGALPEIFTALRIGTGTAVAVLFLAESIGGTSGLGYYIVDAWGRLDYNAMFAGIIAMALMGVLIYELLEIAESRLCRWTRVER